ncbi:MAG: hypothetical protein LBL82_01140 [Oscillospiraceae bacterium]|nr:hypothetical protein [Oscillospiraceae bacterium]
MINKHLALLDWLNTCPLLTSPMLMDSLETDQESIAVIPTQCEEYITRYIRGSGYKRYQFEIHAILAVSSNDDEVNTNNTYLLDTWRNWLEEQDKIHNYPDFGEECSGYSIENLSSTPNIVEKYDSGYAKYRFSSAINYYC